jgi:hypothetical protein
MTCREAYNIYREYYKKNQWSGEDVANYLKRNWIDYEELNFEEFKEKLLSSDMFNQKWANGCTRDLSLKERFELWELIPDRDVMDFPIGQLSEDQYHTVLDQIGVQRREIVN